MIPSTSKEPDNKETDGRALIKAPERPTFILKTREGESRAVSPNHRNGNKKEHDAATSSSTKSDPPRTLIPMYIEQQSCIKLMDENMQLCDGPLEYLYDQQDFLVVGCLGAQGVGKSTVMNLLTSDYLPNIFSTQELSHQESDTNCTTGIDFYVSKNRVIYLDTQPILSGSGMDHTNFDQKKPTADFVNTETNLELQSLQFTAFLFSVCHVIIFVQDWFLDPNLIRFLQTAEMLKPSSTTTSMDQDYVEYYPHILFLHNKVELGDFVPNNIEKMKNFYSKAFSSSRLQIHSGLDMSDSSTDGALNLYLIPRFADADEPTILENIDTLAEKLRIKIHGVSRNSMTPSTLTEKNWYHYVSKVMEAIKKSHLSSEYGRLMP